jgi:hypothetical protein
MVAAAVPSRRLHIYYIDIVACSFLGSSIVDFFFCQKSSFRKNWQLFVSISTSTCLGSVSDTSLTCRCRRRRT